ncbi:MAG: DUF1109 domain-containing protein [Burkholderiales bacterium]|nr:DUF1109 domain-containing protein [Burkholderiales bacterium]
MKTDELIDMLARGAQPVERGAARGRAVRAIGAGFAGSALLLALVLGVRPDLAEAMRVPMFWAKLAFPAALAAGALAAVSRLGRPGMRLGHVPAALAAPVVAMWLLGAAALAAAAPGERGTLVVGHSAASCPFLIALLAAPIFGATLWAMRGLAPTRLASAGAAAGLFAGAGGAFVYSWYCVEMAAPFLAVWYLLGMLLPAMAGALSGPRLLRW